MALQPCKEEELVKQALAKLCEARDLLAQAQAPKTLERVRLAISSCKGAVRNAELKPYRLARQAAASADRSARQGAGHARH